MGAERTGEPKASERDVPRLGVTLGAMRGPALPQVVGNRAFAAMAARSGGLTADGIVHPDVRTAIAAAQGGGRSLDPSLRTDLEAGFGQDLDDVRVHTGTDADALARSVDARAFALGRDVWFAEGQYDPGTESGRRLVAHEVAHTVQQGPAPVPADLQVTNPGDAVESDADRMVDAALSRQPAAHAPLGDADPQVARDPEPGSTAAPPAPASQTTPGGGGTPGGDPAPESFTTEWFIDYQHTGQGMTGGGAPTRTGARTGETGMYVTSFRVHPTIVKPAAADGIFTGVDAAASGAVKLGTYSHPRSAGFASGSVKFGRRPDVKVQLELKTALPDDPKQKRAAQAEFDRAKAAAQAEAQSRLRLSSQGDVSAIQAELESWIASKWPQYTPKVAVQEAGTKGATDYPLTAIPYPEVTGDRQFNVMVNVAEEVEVSKRATSTDEKGRQSQATKGSETATETATTMTIEQAKQTREKMMSVVRIATKEAVEKAKGRINKTGNTELGSWEWGGEGKFSQEIGAELSGDLPLKILGVGIEAALKISGKTAFGLSAFLKRKTETTETKSEELSQSEKTAVETALNSELQKEVENLVSSKVTSVIATKYGVKLSEQTVEGESGKKTEVYDQSWHQKEYKAVKPTISLK